VIEERNYPIVVLDPALLILSFPTCYRMKQLVAGACELNGEEKIRERTEFIQQMDRI